MYALHFKTGGENVSPPQDIVGLQFPSSSPIGFLRENVVQQDLKCYTFLVWAFKKYLAYKLPSSLSKFLHLP